VTRLRAGPSGLRIPLDFSPLPNVQTVYKGRADAVRAFIPASKATFPLTQSITEVENEWSYTSAPQDWSCLLCFDMSVPIEIAQKQ
jgi:hypothetical protein